ncbi:helix-turn-helix domain-containing protein [Stenotrophomonas pictorum]|uniref:helix-turn-helix domain-containing protein n=1 Tax=Stenotrophomonas pictorum TaxID=86184 RepID=UPI0012FE6378
MPMSLAQRLTLARTESGFTEAAEAARKAGVTPSALYQLEDGTTKSLSGQTAVKLGRIYRSSGWSG